MGDKIPLDTITFPGQTDWADKIQQPEKTGAPVIPCAIARAFCGNVLGFCASGHSTTHSPDRGDGVENKIPLGEWASGRVDALPRARPIEGAG